MKAKVDQNICVGSQSCVHICPEVFMMENNKAKVKVDIIPEEAQEQCRRACNECPVSAITIQE